MKHTLSYGLLFMASIASAAVSPADLKHYAEGFSSEDNIGLNAAVREFNQKVPVGERADVLAQVWETQSTAGRFGVLNYLIGARQAVWSAPLAQHLKEAATATDPEMRRVAINVWTLRPPAESRPILTAALDDKLESNRMNAMHAMNVLPDRDAVLTGYLQQHATDKDRKDSRRLAQALLDRKTAEKKK